MRRAAHLTKLLDIIAWPFGNQTFVDRALACKVRPQLSETIAGLGVWLSYSRWKWAPFRPRCGQTWWSSSLHVSSVVTGFLAP